MKALAQFCGLVLTVSQFAAHSPSPTRGWYGLSIRPQATAGPIAIVDDVFPNGPAERAGLAPGDTLIQLGSYAATTALGSGLLDRARSGDTLVIFASRGPLRFRAIIRAEPRPTLESDDIGGGGVVVIHLDSLRHLMGDYLDAARRRITVVAPAGFRVERSDSALVLRNEKTNFRLRLDSLLAAGSTNTDSAGRLRVVRTRPTRLAGMLVAEVPAKLAGSTAGVVIASIDRSSRLENAGLRPLDVIVRFNGISIGSMDALRAAVAKIPSRPFIVEIRRGNERLSVRVP